MKKKITKILFFLIGFLIFSNLFKVNALASCASGTSLSLTSSAQSCSFSSTIDGVDAGTGSTNTGTISLSGAGTTLTVNTGQTIAYGTITLGSGTSIVITKPGGAHLVKGPIYVTGTDNDGDGYASNITQSTTTGTVRRNAVSLTTADCNDSNANVYQNVANIATDADSDGYYTGSPATTCVGGTSTINSRTYYKDTSGSYTEAVSSAELGGSDCNDADATLYQNLSGYVDGDGDGWPANANLVTGICSGATIHSGYIASLPGAVGCGGICTSPAPTKTSQTQIPITADWTQGAGVQIGTSAYLYSIGGYNNSSTWYSSVYVGVINSSGNIGAWNATTAFPRTNLETTAAIATIGTSSYIYVVGGRNSTVSTSLSTVYKAQINSTTGALGAWTATTALPIATRDNATVVATVGGTSYLYSIGGCSGACTAMSSVYKSQIAAAGTVGAWSAVTAFPAAANYINANHAVINGSSYIYTTGDTNSGNAVRKAALDASGNITGGWVLDSYGPYGATVASFDSTTLYGSTYLYATGGSWGSNLSTASRSVMDNSTGGTAGGGFTQTGQGQLPALVGHSSTFIYNGTGGSTYMYTWGGGTNAIKSQIQEQTNIDCNDGNATIHPGAGC